MSWEKHEIGDFLEYFSVKAKQIDDYNNLEFFGVSNELGITISKYAAEDKPEEYKIIEKGCFAYNPYRINVGSIALMQEEKRGLISPAYVVFKTKPNSIVPELLLKFLKSSEGLRQIKKHARGTVRQALRFEDLCKIEIALPDYKEQLLLYKNLESAHNKFEEINLEHTKQLDFLKKLRQQILQDAVQGKLVPQDPNDEPASKLLERIKTEKEKLVREKKIKKEKLLPEIKPEEIPFEIPENWVWCRLGEMSINRDGYRKPISQIERERSEKIYDYYGASGVIDKIDGYTHDGEYLLIGEDGANLKLKSTPIAFKAKGKFWVNNHAHVLDFIDLITMDYMKNCLNCIDINSFITGGFQPKLSQGNLNLIPVPLPTLQMQQLIVAKIKQLMTICDALEQTIQQNQKYTQELLQMALKEALEGKN